MMNYFIDWFSVLNVFYRYLVCTCVLICDFLSKIKWVWYRSRLTRLLAENFHVIAAPAVNNVKNFAYETFPIYGRYFYLVGP